MHPQALLVSQIRNLQEKWYRTGMFTHFPKDRNCEACKKTKITRAPYWKRTGYPVTRAEMFGDLIAADHKVLSEDCESRNNHRYAVVVQDSAARWIQSHPCETKSFSGDGKEFTKVSRVVGQAKTHLHSKKNPWNLAKLLKNCPGIIVHPRLAVPRQMVLLRARCAASRREPSAVLLQSSLNEKW